MSVQRFLCRDSPSRHLLHWQRGSNENANGLIREYPPKGSDLSGTSQEELNAIANLLNERPRRILGYQTPREVFANLLADEQLNTSTT